MKPFSKPGKRKRFYIYLASLLCWILTVTTSNPVSFQFQPIQGASPAGITTNTLPQITGPQKADGMWSIKIDPVSSYYDHFYNILPSPLGDLVILNSINEVDYLTCIDPNGNTKWIWKEKRASTSAFAYLDNLMETSLNIILFLLKLFWESQNFYSKHINNIKILQNGGIVFSSETTNFLRKTNYSLNYIRGDGKPTWKKRLNDFFTINANQLVYLESSNWNLDGVARSIEVVALNSDGEMLWKTPGEFIISGYSYSTWIENIGGEDNYYTIYQVDQYLRMESIDKNGNYIVEKKEIKISQLNSLFSPFLEVCPFLGHETNDFSRSNIAFTVITEPDKPTNNQPAIEAFFELYFSDWNETYLIDSYNTNTKILEPVIDNVHKQIIVFAQERNPMNHELYDCIYVYDFDGNKKWEKLINQRVNQMNENDDLPAFAPYQIDDNYNIYFSLIEAHDSAGYLSVSVYGINAEGKVFLHKSIPFEIPAQYGISTTDYVFYAPRLAKIGYKGQIILFSNTNFDEAPGSYNTLTVLYDKE